MLSELSEEVVELLLVVVDDLGYLINVIVNPLFSERFTQIFNLILIVFSELVILIHHFGVSEKIKVKLVGILLEGLPFH